MNNNSSARQPILTFNQVSIGYEKNPPIVQDINLTINAGDFYFLTGASGAGKSSFLKLMYMGIVPVQGELKIFGYKVNEITRSQASEIRQQIGIVFQDFNLLEHLTIIENVTLPLKIRGIDSGIRYQQAKELLEWVGLKDHLHSYPPAISGGQRQLATIATAIIGQPKLILADEPTGSVDEKMAMKLLYLFDELHKMGTTIIFATHHRDFARVLGYPELIIAKQKLTMRSFSKSIRA